jgi:hypothetical protein
MLRCTIFNSDRGHLFRAKALILTVAPSLRLQRALAASGASPLAVQRPDRREIVADGGRCDAPFAHRVADLIETENNVTGGE